MAAFALLLALSCPGAATSQPSWYGGRHAVLIVVDGLGDGYFERLRAAGHLARTGELFGAQGLSMPAASAHWPGRGADEARSAARGQRLTFDADGSFTPPGAERWPLGSFALFGGDDGAGLRAALAKLPRPGEKRLPPVLAVVHERRFAAALGQHGAGSVEAGRALARIDEEIAALRAAYAALGLADRSYFALVSPSGLQRTTRRLDPEALFRELNQRRAKRSPRLASLLSSFEPVTISARGGVALLSPRAAQGNEAVPTTPSLEDLLAAAGVARSRARPLIERIARQEGVALVVARQKPRGSDQAFLLVANRSGRAQLEQRPLEQLRYKVLSGRDPLQLAAVPDQLGASRFHAAEVWRAASAQLAVVDAPARVASLLDLADGAALAVVAQPGVAFDAAQASAGPSGKALLRWSGPGLAGSDPRPVRTVDVAPTLIALVGAPLDERLQGVVLDDVIEASTAPGVRGMCRLIVERAIEAFNTDRSHNASVIDTTEVRRFGTPPKYFRVVRGGLLQTDALSYLPTAEIQRQIGPRRSLLIATTALSNRVERLVLRRAPNEIRRFDPLIRPELMLAGFLEDPVMRSRLRILEGPQQRARARTTSIGGGEAAELR